MRRSTIFYLFFSLLLGIGFNSNLYANSEHSSASIDTIGQYLTIEKAANSVNPWSHLNFYNDPQNFQFAIVTDRTGGNRPGIFSVGIDKLNLLKPEFVMSVGDLIEGYTEDIDQLNREWDEFEGFISKLEAPFFYTPGNHDITNEVMEDIWEERFGRTYYHFVYKDVLFLALNSEEAIQGSGGGGIEDEQYEYIKKVLDDHPNVRWTMVFAHQPMWEYDNPRRWWDVEALLEGRNHTVFVGHYHSYVKEKRNKSNYYVLATTGGGSNLRGPLFGEFDHLVWVTMTDNGPVLANLMLDGIYDDNIRTKELASMVNQVSSDIAMTIQPKFDEELPHNYTARIQNYSNSPMNALVTIKTEDRIIQNDFLVEIEPNSVEMIEFESEQYEQIQVTADYTYSFEGYTQLETSQILTLEPQQFHSLSKRPRVPKIDGNLKEWGELRYSSEHVIDVKTGLNSTSEDGFRFDATMRGGKLVVAVDVTDSDLYTPTSAGHLSQDAIGMIIDAYPLEESSQNVMDQEKVFDRWFPLLLTPDKNEVTELAYQDLIGKHLTGALIRTEKGYSAEFMIPIKAIMKRLTDGDGTFRLNIVMNDFDEDGSSHKTMSWTPVWGEANSPLGSGTFSFDAMDLKEEQ